MPSPKTVKPVTPNVLRKRLITALEAPWHLARPSEMLGLVHDRIASSIGTKIDAPRAELVEYIEPCTEAYLALVRASPPWEDLLSAVFHDVVWSKGRGECLGQFFTPQCVCDMMAKMILGDGASFASANPSSTDGLWRIADPAVGAGGMMLAALRQIESSVGMHALENVAIHGTDIDMSVAKLCALQITSNLLVHKRTIGGAEVWCGNSLGPLNDHRPVLVLRRPADARQIDIARITHETTVEVEQAVTA